MILGENLRVYGEKMQPPHTNGQDSPLFRAELVELLTGGLQQPQTSQVALTQDGEMLKKHKTQNV